MHCTLCLSYFLVIIFELILNIYDFERWIQHDFVHMYDHIIGSSLLHTFLYSTIDGNKQATFKSPRENLTDFFRNLILCPTWHMYQSAIVKPFTKKEVVNCGERLRCGEGPG